MTSDASISFSHAAKARSSNTAQRDRLVILTCGSVDDGKSTLLGRMLVDTDQVYDDQLSALKAVSKSHGSTGDALDYALLIDGLEMEREQGITIDVAYRYFSTARRSFIVADCPGHEQYTRNMVTGASQADAAILLVDASKGLLAQTRRHAHIVSLIGIRHVILAINKMDLVAFSADRFANLEKEFRTFAQSLNFNSIVAIPLVARDGDNVVHTSGRMPWFKGQPLIECLETVDTLSSAAAPLRLPIQRANRPNADFRGYSGTLTSGQIAVGDTIVVAQTEKTACIQAIHGPRGQMRTANAGDAVTIVLDTELDIARGDIIAQTQTAPKVVEQFDAMLIWMSEAPLMSGRTYALRSTSRWATAQIVDVHSRVDIDTTQASPADTLSSNEIGRVTVKSSIPLALDLYHEHRETGSFVLVDRMTDETVAAGLVVGLGDAARSIRHEQMIVDRVARERLLNQKSTAIWLTGLSGAGKSTIAKMLEKVLHDRGRTTYVLDGDNVREGLNRDLGFSDRDRIENIRRIGEVARLFVDAGVIVICSFISPFRAERQLAREMFQSGDFFEVFVDAPIEECIRRDPKGLYAKALAGRIKKFTGVDSPYEPPTDPDLHVRTVGTQPSELVEQIISMLEARHRL